MFGLGLLEQIGIAILSLTLTFGAGYGWRWMGDGERNAARQLQEEHLAAEDYKLRKKAATFDAAKTETKQAETRVVFKQINTVLKEIVTREVYRNVCIDDDGLRLWNDANQGRGHEGVQRLGVDRQVPEGTPHAPVEGR